MTDRYRELLRLREEQEFDQRTIRWLDGNATDFTVQNQFASAQTAEDLELPLRRKAAARRVDVASLLDAERDHQVSRILFESLIDSSTPHGRVSVAIIEERSVHENGGNTASKPVLDDGKREALTRYALLIAIADLAQTVAEEK